MQRPLCFAAIDLATMELVMTQLSILQSDLRVSTVCWARWPYTGTLKMERV